MRVTQRRVNRAEPVGPTHAYQTYSIQAPLETHFVKATCPEVDCKEYKEGWTLRVQHLNDRLWAAIKNSKRRYRRMDLTAEEGYLIFEPGQLCFQVDQHKRKLERPEFYLVGRGDWRSFRPRNATQLKTGLWLEHLYEHLDLIKQLNKRG